MTKAFKYKAFISYSHQDKKWGDWLHKKLETYKVPKGLIGKQTGAGIVPKTLFPIFRDREELPTSHQLGKVIGQALRDSSHLLIICSPRSAKSQWVNEEIKEFKRLGKSNNILCLIIGGEPNAADKPGFEEEECFPEAAKYEIGQDGELGTQRTEPIAADAREGKDGKRNSLLKVVAGLLGVGFDDLKQRDLLRKQKRMAILSGVSMALVAVMAGLTLLAFDREMEAKNARIEAENARLIAETERKDSFVSMSIAWEVFRQFAPFQGEKNKSLDEVKRFLSYPFEEDLLELMLAEKQSAGVYLSLGKIYLSLGKKTEGLMFLEKSQKEEIETQSFSAIELIELSTYLAIAKGYLEMHDDAIEDAMHAVALSSARIREWDQKDRPVQDLYNELYQAYCYLTLSEAYKAKNDIEKTVNYLQQSSQICFRTLDKVYSPLKMRKQDKLIAIALRNSFSSLLPVIIEKLGQAILELGKPEMAIDHYSESGKKLSRFVSRDDQALRWIKALSSHACFQNGQFEKGKSLLREASKKTFSSKEYKQSDFLNTGHWSIDTQFEIKKATSLIENF